MEKKFESHEKQVKAAKGSGNSVQLEKVKDRAKIAAAKEASKKKKAKGKSGGIYTVEFHFPEPIELTQPLLQLIEVNFGYPNRQDFRLSKVGMGIDMGTRVGIVGPNGTGKSTLRLAGDLGKCEGARN
ncbi:hypothetical protein KPL70_001430 [Citrus sinensis]|nr:hypothetical protein KPL70_001430 [Citrus sinensis]